MNEDANTTTTKTAAVAEQGAASAPTKATSTRKASQKNPARKAKGAGKTAAPCAGDSARARHHAGRNRRPGRKTTESPGAASAPTTGRKNRCKRVERRKSIWFT